MSLRVVRVIGFALGVATFAIGMYMAWAPIGRIVAAVSGVVLMVVGVLICIFAALTTEDDPIVRIIP